MTSHTFDVVVLGAGIVGAACARECALAGLRVAVVEPSVPGGAASAAGMGHVVVMDDSPAQLALSHLGRDLWKQLRTDLPATVEYEERGTLWVASDDEEMQEVYAKRKTYAEIGVSSDVLDEYDVAEAEPNLRPGLAGGLRVQQDAVIYPPAAARFFLDEALRLGGVLFRNRRATRAAHGEVLLSDGTRISAKSVIIASGTDTALLPWLPIKPRKGHLVITDRYPDFVRHQIVELGYLKSAHSVSADSVAFNVQPRKTGQLLLGSSRQYGDVDPAITPAILKRMIDRAAEYLPALHGLSVIRAWTGFRASTPDKLPLIGPTDDPSIHLAVGFEGLGITNAPAAARLAVDHLLGRTSSVDATPYRPGRFAKEATAA